MPANTSIILALVVMQRDQSVWGEDAEVLDINRWLRPDGSGVNEMERFMSWNYGPRLVSLLTIFVSLSIGRMITCLVSVWANLLQ
jgi:hypothetical protein